MTIRLNSLLDLPRLGFDMLIDARSPSEHADDHLPGAVSMPVLSDEERARVGTIYKQVSPFDARKVGGALVARNVAAHLEGPLAAMGGGFRPLLYCWRGGQRSGAFETILASVGWRAARIEGGYKAWRSLVVEALYERAPLSSVVLLDGNTGSAKTELLAELARLGVQVLDLEGLANHRGSLFGARAGAQPSQRGFEGRLAMAMAGLDPARPVVVEAESAAIGQCRLPPELWKAMARAPRILLDVPADERARYLTRAYGDVIADPERLLGVVEKLRPWQPASRIAAWQAMIGAGEWAGLARELMEWHYDPRYARHRARLAEGEAGAIEELPVSSLAPEALPGVAADIAGVLARLSRL